MTFAKNNNWSVDDILILGGSKRRAILEKCGLPATKSTQKFISKFITQRMTVEHIDLIDHILSMPTYQQLNHLISFDFRLLHFIQKNPTFINSRLINSYSIDAWDWHRFEHDLDGIYRIMELLQIRDSVERSFACANMVTLRNLHDSLVDRLNEKDIASTPVIPFSAPPFEGNSTIIPLTDTRELKKEGMTQRHCVYSYHEEIIKGEYYVYKITEPQRATLGIARTKSSWVADQLKLHRNEKPSEETIEIVMTWLDEQNRKGSVRNSVSFL